MRISTSRMTLRLTPKPHPPTIVSVFQDVSRFNRWSELAEMVKAFITSIEYGNRFDGLPVAGTTNAHWFEQTVSVRPRKEQPRTLTEEGGS